MSDTSPTTTLSPASAPAERVVVPVPAGATTPAPERPAPDPTRYGDWEKNGRCIDF